MTKITSGLYPLHSFNDVDFSLQKAGLYCEELIPYLEMPTVLRNLKKAC